MGGGSNTNGVEVIGNKGCSKPFVGLSSSSSSSSSSMAQPLRLLQSIEPASAAVSSVGSDRFSWPNGPFSGLVICVTGLSKEARKQVMEATERLGGQYSPHLHPQCTHLVVQSFGGRKLDHAQKHGWKNGLFVVTLGWFVDSVKRNVRLSESLYSMKGVGENGVRLDDLNQVFGSIGAERSCLPAGINEVKPIDLTKLQYGQSPARSIKRSVDSPLSGSIMYIDGEISNELRKKVYEAARGEGATLLDQWFAGCKASHVICEGASVQKYIGYGSNLVSPMWVIKSAKEKYMQRLFHMSVDLARQVGNLLENYQRGVLGQETNMTTGFLDTLGSRNGACLEERQQVVIFAKNGVRNRRGRRMQTCLTPIRPITPSSLLDSVCWSVSEPASTASTYTDSLSNDNMNEHQTPVFFDAKADKDSEASFLNFTRPLSESEKSEVVFRSHFLTILFPVDRFAEMGPSSRTFFSENGFTCMQVLEHIYAFYQENMSSSEVEAAIHTDSRHADRLRSVYSSKESVELGYVVFKRIEFLGSRKSFEMLKRVGGDNSSNVYELLIRA